MIQVKVFLNTLNEQSQCLIFIEHESIGILLHDLPNHFLAGYFSNALA